jgi:hypothetical protein
MGASDFSLHFLPFSPIADRVLLCPPFLSCSDADFLSSIELVIVDQLDVMEMQNWDHLQVRLPFSLSPFLLLSVADRVTRTVRYVEVEPYA